jgi:hypothetical protein
VSRRQIVVALVAVSILGWVLAAIGIGGKFPSTPYIVVDVAVEGLLLVGIWFRNRLAWWLLLVGTALGVLLGAARLVGGAGGREAVLLVIGLVQLALLTAPGLRREFGPRAQQTPA